jgi:arylsulfatase A-like enzyme/Flp pilus assembly protein TadD
MGLHRTKRWMLCLAAMAALGSQTCRHSPRVPDARADGGYNLLLITLDTTRADRLGAYGYTKAQTPNLDRLAREGARFTDCHTSVPLTLPAHCTLLTGREPPAHQVRNNGAYTLPESETTLAELFRKAGYSTQALVASFVLQSKFGLAQGFDLYNDTLDLRNTTGDFASEIPADRLFAKFSHWLKNRRSGRFFTWVHFYDPHAPYEPPKDWAERCPGSPYDGEISFMDHYLGEIVRELAEQNLLKKTLIVVCGDHGEAFGEHAEFKHGVFCYEETLRVPLIFWQPRLFKKRTVSQPVGLVDVLPTVLELYGLGQPAGLQGRSFARQLGGAGEEARGSGPARYFETMQGMEEVGWAPLTGVLRPPYKYISLPEPELYDLENDPLEKKNLYLRKNLIARDLERQLRGRLAQITSRAPVTARRQISGPDQERLRALGYLASSAPGSPAAGKTPTDPKQGVILLNRLQNIRQQIREKAYAEARQKLDELRQEGVPAQLPLYYDVWYELQTGRGDAAATEACLREARSRYPDQSRFTYMLATVCRDRGKTAEAITIATEALTQDPLLTRMHILLAQIYRQQGRLPDAVAHIDRAVQLEPHNSRLWLELANLQREAGQQPAAKATLRSMLGMDEFASGEDAAILRREAAKLLLQMGENAQAESLFEKIVDGSNKSAEDWAQLGLAQLDRGENDRARQSLQQALAVDPDQPLARSGLATLQLNSFREQKNGELLQQAGDNYQRALRIAPNLVSARNGMGVVCLYAGRFDLAIANLQAAIRIDPAFTRAHFNLAIAYLARGRRGDARRVLLNVKERYATRLNDDDRRQLAGLLAETGR